jgi:hypothetical protein
MAFLQNIVPSGTSATADFTTGIIELKDNLTINNMSIQVIGTGLSTTDSTIKLQQSNSKDTASFSDVLNSDNTSFTITMSSSVMTGILTNVAFKYYRIVFTKNTNAAGTIQVLLNFN